MGIDALIGSRLADAGVAGSIADLVLAAARGDDELAAALRGEPVAPAPGLTAAEGRDGPGFFLGTVSVTGFRGVSTLSLLRLQPRPGLTLVVGRNGSGKSSFAEAVELGLVGTCSRWADRTTVDWKNGWRNLHHQGARKVEVVLRDEHGADTTITRTWDADAHDVDGGDVAVGGRHTIESLALDRALVEHPPILSYNELGEMLHKKPSELHDAIGRGLGTDDLDAVRDRLRAARLDLKRALDQHKEATKRLVTDLGAVDDPRAERALAALAAKPPDLAGLRDVLTHDADDVTELAHLQAIVALTPPDDDAVTGVAADIAAALDARERATQTVSERAERLAELLTQALALHDHDPAGDTCPVCGTAGVIDDDWATRTESAVAEQRRLGQALRAASEQVRVLDARSRDLIAAVPPVLTTSVIDVAALRTAWSEWAELRDEPDPAVRAKALDGRRRALVDALLPVQSAARAELERRSATWAPFVPRIATWLEPAAVLADGATRLKAITEAETWMRDTVETVRAERLAPVLDRVRAVWDTLRRDSNVALGEIELSGTGSSRKARIAVQVDDEESVALSVMSQGELHAFALSLFLPRATMDESPFRFVVIDDPVQAMDAARVEGLARVLHEIAADRQVVVFTHDERLPRVCRHLELDVRIIEVTRDAHSVVTTRTRSNPGDDLAEDARKFLKDRDLPAEIKARVVPGICRQAVEAAAIDVVWRRGIARGWSHARINDQLDETLKLKEILALALLGDADRAGEVLGELNRRPGPWAADVVQQCDRGTHGDVAGIDLESLARGAAGLVEHLAGVRVT